MDGIHIGTSGWSYPTWRPAFYPAGMDPKEFLSFYAQRFDTVELNTTGYRLPSEEQFERWAAQVPERFTFAVKMPLTRLDRVGTFVERVRALGDHLGPIRITVQTARDDGLLAFVLGSLDPELPFAFDFRHPSWDDVEGVPRVDDPAAPGFRYLRLREPPYDDATIAELARTLRPPSWVFFRHEDAPTAPTYAERLRALVSGS
jgi:uncharacterized protein YecE (DUF72 family)